MKTPRWLVQSLVPLLIVSHTGALRYAHGAPVLITPKEQGEGNVREFFSSNREKRFLIRVHIWGDVSAPGVYYLPDNATLLDALGYSGGSTGVLSKTEISLSRIYDTRESKDAKIAANQKTVRIDGEELVEQVSYRDMVLRNGDVIHLDSPPKVDTFMRTLSIFSTFLGIITATISVYLVTKK